LVLKYTMTDMFIKVFNFIIEGSSKHASDIILNDEQYNFMPFQMTIIEAIIVSLLCTSAMFIAKNLKVNENQLKKRAKPKKMTILDHIFGLILLTNLILVIYYKLVSHKVIDLLQPCHVNTMIMLIVIYGSQSISDLAFNVFLHEGIWATALAVMFPLSRYYYPNPFELENYYIQHYVLIFIPFFYTYIERHEIEMSNRMSIITAAAIVLYHYVVLLPFNLYFKTNVNYILYPPESGSFLFFFWKVLSINR